MDINLISAPEYLYSVQTAGGQVVEYCRDSKNKYLIHINLYDPENNTVQEVTPQRHKINFVDIVNGIWNCRDVYYTSFEMLPDNKIRIFLYQFPVESRQEKLLYSFDTNMDVISGNTSIKIFLLSETTVLVQTEEMKSETTQNMLGNIAFHLELYNSETAALTTVTDSNFINNGINSIVPVSDKKIMVKTGSSYLEDSRLGIDMIHESLIESVYVTTVAKFIADITISTDSVDMPLVESAYQDKHILAPRVNDPYTHFSVVDVVNKTTKCVFFHNETDDRLEYTLNSFDAQDMYITNVINNTPYVRRKGVGAVNFFNLKKAETDITFFEETFIEQLEKVFFLFSDQDPGKLRIYSLPKLKRELSEKLEYVCSTRIDDTYYVYIR